MSVTHATPGTLAPPAADGGRALPGQPAGWTGTAIRLAFGVIWGIDAALKWLPGYRHHYISNLREAAEGQPSWLHWWFRFWINLQKGNPTLFADLTGVAETGLALVLLLGLARRLGYTLGAIYSLLVWAVGEGFGGPYESGSTDVGTGIVYALMFATLLVFAPPARRDRLSIDRRLAARWPWWRKISEPHSVDRVHGAPLIEPVVVGRTSLTIDGAEPGRDGG